MKYGVLLVAMFLIASFHSAQAIDLPAAFERELPDAGSTPDSFMYGFHRFLEGVDFAFTFDEVARAEKHVRAAEMRLAEARAMAEQGKPEFVDGLLEEYEDNIDRANRIAQLAQGLRTDAANVTELVAAATSMHRDVLSEVLERVPEQARPAVQRAMNSSERENQEALNGLERERPERAAEIHFRIANRRLERLRDNINESDPGKLEEDIGEYRNRIRETNRIIVIARNSSNYTGKVEELVAEVTSQHVVVLSEVYERVPQEAKAAVKNALDASISQREAITEALRNLGGADIVPRNLEIPEETERRIESIINREIQAVREETGDLDLLVSDAPADIADFESLIVGFSKARIFQSGEPGGFEEFELNETSVDLTKLVGDQAVSVLDADLAAGTYTKVELYVSDANGTVNGTGADVMVPSDRLQMVKPFEIRADETTKYVFDINVVKRGQEMEYNLLPVISGSGTVGEDIPEQDFNETECTVDIDCDEDETCIEGECERGE